MDAAFCEYFHTAFISRIGEYDSISLRFRIPSRSRRSCPAFVLFIASLYLEGILGFWFVLRCFLSQICCGVLAGTVTFLSCDCQNFGHLKLSAIEFPFRSIGSTCKHTIREKQRLRSMWSSNNSRESETNWRRRTREERREAPSDNGATRQAGIWMVLFLGAAAVSVSSPFELPPETLNCSALLREPTFQAL